MTSGTSPYVSVLNEPINPAFSILGNRRITRDARQGCDTCFVPRKDTRMFLVQCLLRVIAHLNVKYEVALRGCNSLAFGLVACNQLLTSSSAHNCERSTRATPSVSSTSEVSPSIPA